MIVLIDLTILIMVVMIISDFYKGFLIAVCSMIIMPFIIRFQLGPINLSVIDVMTGAMMVSLFLHYKEISARIPKWLRVFLVVEVLSAYLLAFMSEVVPIPNQLISLTKVFFTSEIPMLLMTYWAMREIPPNRICKWLMVTFICVGLYGIFTYIIKFNPYIFLASMTYQGEEASALEFINEARGVLQGRIMGTAIHPLAWGLYWVITMSFVIIYKERINTFLFYLFFVVGIVNIVLCGSRAALIGFFVSIFFYLVYLGSVKAIRLVLIVFSIGAVAFSSIASQEAKQYAASIVFFWDDDASQKADIHGSNSNMRRQQLDESLNIAFNTSLGGLGYGYVSFSQENNIEEKTMMGYESILFKKLVEQGLGGVFFFFILFFLLAIQILKCKRYVGRSYLLIIGFFCSYLVTIVITGNQGVSYILFLILFISSIALFDSQRIASIDSSIKEVYLQ